MKIDSKNAIWFAAALYGCLFTQESEAAFSNYRMWESLGFIIAFAYSNYICTSVKLYILISVLSIGMIGYFIVEWLHRKEHKPTAINATRLIIFHSSKHTS